MKTARFPLNRPASKMTIVPGLSPARSFAGPCALAEEAGEERSGVARRARARPQVSALLESGARMRRHGSTVLRAGRALAPWRGLAREAPPAAHPPRENK